MNALDKTILGDAEQLAQLHDIMHFKGLAYDEQNIAGPLKGCAVLLNAASRALIKDVVYQLSAKNFPFSSREKGAKAPTEDPLKILNNALALFPERHALPDTDVTLRDIPQVLEKVKEHITEYSNDKTIAIAELMKLQSQVVDYLICITWLDI